jgi:peptidyl-prolyl cis-trans isomerase A (cyclophilin A)
LTIGVGAVSLCRAMHSKLIVRTGVSLTLALAVGCKSGPPPEPESRKAPPPEAQKVAAAEPVKPVAPPTPPPAAAPKPVAEVAVADGDPAKGKFTLEEATKGLAGDGKLVAEMKTDKGTLKCELWPDKAPITVANFVGLARGLRPWKTQSGEWAKKPLYDGTPFHRIIRGFMIQGGDPRGNGSGEPGFVIPDEIWPGAHHDQRGLLCMANRGPNTNGSQFFIMDGVAAHLDGGYTIFGKCSPDSVIEAIATSEVAGDRATNPPKIQKVTVSRVKG